jgi:hypothetical protein
MCNLGTADDPRGSDPGYEPTTGSTRERQVPSCTSGRSLFTFAPGLYTDASALNALADCPESVLHFPPGTYYFNLPADTPWLIENQYVVGGTPTGPLGGGHAPGIPGSCHSPIPPKPNRGWNAPGPGAGVQFVIGGGTQIILRDSQMELCGDYERDNPAIAVYGLKSAVGPVPAQNGCTTQVPYPQTGCATITLEDSPSARLYIQGTTYLPAGALDVVLHDSGRQFTAGLIARTLRITATAENALEQPVVDLPSTIPAGRRTVIYLNVYLCPSSDACSSMTGVPKLRAKIGLLDPSGEPVAGAREVTVLTWSVLR